MGGGRARGGNSLRGGLNRCGRLGNDQEASTFACGVGTCRCTE
jgi:hypothetical protein